MPRFLATALVFLFWLLVWGCSNSSKITNPENQPPVISALAVTPEVALAGTLIEVSCRANDPEGEPVSYKWSSIFGYFSGSGATVSYHTEGCCLGLNQITLVATDTKGNSSQRKIWVNIEK